MKIQTGKTYVNGFNDHIKIVRRLKTGKFPFYGHDGERYSESGQCMNPVADTVYSLTSESPCTVVPDIFELNDGVFAKDRVTIGCTTITRKEALKLFRHFADWLGYELSE